MEAESEESIFRRTGALSFLGKAVSRESMDGAGVESCSWDYLLCELGGLCPASRLVRMRQTAGGSASACIRQPLATAAVVIGNMMLLGLLLAPGSWGLRGSVFPAAIPPGWAGKHLPYNLQSQRSGCSSLPGQVCFSSFLLTLLSISDTDRQVGFLVQVTT